MAAVLSSGRAAAAEGEARGWGRLASLARHPAPEAPGGVAPGQARRVSWLKQLAEAADLRCGRRARLVPLRCTHAERPLTLSIPLPSPESSLLWRFRSRAHAVMLCANFCKAHIPKPGDNDKGRGRGIAGLSEGMHQGCLLQSMQEEYHRRDSRIKQHVIALAREEEGQ